MNILILMSKISPPNLKTALLKQIAPIALLFNLLPYFIIVQLLMYLPVMLLYNLTMSNYIVFNFPYILQPKFVDD